MEFLSPEEKKSRTVRLFTGYALITVLIGLATLILVYLAQGYGYNPSKGVSQNGLVFFSAKPGSADIFIDNQQKDKTDARLTVVEGVHQITLKKESYRDWAKTITVDGGGVLYLTYPRLFPVNIPLGITQAFATPPVWSSQSPDRRWLLIQAKNDTPTVITLDLLKPTAESKSSAIPAAQLTTEAGNYGVFSAVEWSDDNKHVLLKQALPSGKVSYIVYDREDPTQSINVTKKMSLPDGYSLTLRDKKYDKYYAYNQSTGELRLADTKTGMQAVALINSVVGFKSYADNLVLYVTYSGVPDGQAGVFIRDGQTDTYKLQNLPRNPENRYLLDMAKYENNWYYITASTTDKKALLYRDPLSRIKPSNATPASPRLALVIDNPQFASFSDNARFVGLQSGNKFVVFDAELVRVYRYVSPLSIPAQTEATWMDGHRYSVVSDGKTYVFEFDGSNQQFLVASRSEFTPYFDRDYEFVYTLVPQADGRTGLQNGQIVLTN